LPWTSHNHAHVVSQVGITTPRWKSERWIIYNLENL
jgi:hypothetical protein